MGPLELIFVLALAAFSLHEGWIALQNSTVVLGDLRLLLQGLTIAFTGSASEAAALPMQPPDIQRDRSIFAILTFVLFALNWSIRLLLVEPLVRSTLELPKPKAIKFSQSVMEIVVYGSFTIIGLFVVPSQENAWPSARWWKGFADGGHELMRSDLRCFYILYIARYFQAGVSLLLEFRRKDFIEMVVHHLVTVVVIYISYVYGWNRVGMVVMLLLDPGDVPLHMAKLCKYIAEANDTGLWQFLADRLFEIFGVVFFVTRIVLYGYVCWSAHIEASRYFPKGLPEWTCVALLYTLFMLQVYWFSLIAKVAIRLLAGKSVEDTRSDDETDPPKSKGQKKAE